MQLQTLCVLGSTGSVGRQALEVAAAQGIPVRALTGGQNAARMEAQARACTPELVAMADEAAAAQLRERLFGSGIEVLAGPQGVERAAAVGCDAVLSAILGAAGILPTLAAIKTGCRVALANKEALVAAGSIVMPAVRRHGATLLPVDSEHSAIFQCLLAAGPGRPVRRVLLTASGGPFFGRTRAELAQVTARQALAHPSWRMGGKITVDSATLMNKGLEVIELAVLFDLPLEKIEVLVHRESIVHSMVEFEDRAVMAQLGRPDMRVPIQYALTCPQRLPLEAEPLDLAALGRLSFAAPDEQTFGALELCRRAYRSGGTAPAALSAANEVAVGLFLRGGLPFLAIEQLCRAVLDRHVQIEAPTLEQILAADLAARAQAATLAEPLRGAAQAELPQV